MPEQVRLPLEPAVSLNATLACTLIGCELLSSAPTVKATPEELRVLTNDTCARHQRLPIIELQAVAGNRSSS
eukprot:m.202587 g.202587  ORF g.202587 m.202587 type:complete len:72 (+) comp17064_c0_seq48:163-378(+)